MSDRISQRGVNPARMALTLVGIGVVVVGVAWLAAAQEPSTASARSTVGTTSDGHARQAAELLLRAREDAAVAKAYRDARQADVRLAEAMIQHAQAYLDHVEAMHGREMLPDTTLLAARVGVIDREAGRDRARSEFAAAEAQLRRAERRVQDPDLPPLAIGPDTIADMLRRLRELESATRTGQAVTP